MRPIIQINGDHGKVNLYSDDTLTLAICEDVDAETGEPTQLFETTPHDLFAALGRSGCVMLLQRTSNTNERAKLEEALVLSELK